MCYSSQSPAEAQEKWPEKIQTVLNNTKRLDHDRGGRLPLYLWPAMDPGKMDSRKAEELVREMDLRGIGVISSWKPDNRDECLENALVIARAQKKLGLRVNINATTLLYSFFNGDERTAHIDENGETFFDSTFGESHKMGCPFALDFRKDEIRERVEYYAKAYRDEGIDVDFIWADWEVDGPIEFNGAHAASKRCVRCREAVGDIDNFLEFQKTLREIRIELQHDCYSEPLLRYHPDALVGNYAVYPHNGYRYWYDYFEYYAEGQPYIQEQGAKYRLWYNDFSGTGYTFAMPVVYAWARLFSWYDFENTDYRWFYNMLLVASNACRYTPAGTPVISFVHRNMINPKEYSHPDLTPFSETVYKELLWHMLLRGTDTFYMWSGSSEFANETALLHEVYAAAQEYGDFLEHGVPLAFDVPREPGPVVSVLKLGNRLLVRRTDFDSAAKPATLRVDGRTIEIPPNTGRCSIIDLD